MSSGDARSDAAPVGAVVRMIQREPGLRDFLSRPQIVSRKFLVPYGAGRSMDGGMTYMNEGVPVRFKMGVEPDRATAGHEGFEWWLMTRKGLRYWVGPSPTSAHWWAEGYEHYLLKLEGWSDDEIAAYEAEWDEYISEDEAARISPETVPPDLYQGPYEPAMDSDETEAGMDARILPILQAARARMLVMQEARLIA
jgi:hypothetical protein